MVRYLAFLILPLAAFFAQFARTVGVITQVYFVQEDTFNTCAHTCIFPDIEQLNETSLTPGCCKGPGSNRFDTDACDRLGINLLEDNTAAIYYEQDPFNTHSLLWIDYIVIITAILPMLASIAFSIWAAYYCWQLGPRAVKHCVNAIIDMGFPKDLNSLHYSAYYGDISYVRKSLNVLHIDVNSQLDSGDTALHLAAQNGFSEICYFLVKEHNADTSLKNKKGQTAVDIAKLENYELIYRYLTHLDVRSAVKRALSHKEEPDGGVKRPRPATLIFADTHEADDLNTFSDMDNDACFETLGTQLTKRTAIVNPSYKC